MPIAVVKRLLNFINGDGGLMVRVIYRGVRPDHVPAKDFMQSIAIDAGDVPQRILRFRHRSKIQAKGTNEKANDLYGEAPVP